MTRRPPTLRALFEAALEHTSATRDAFIDTACGSDASLAGRVRRLLDAHARAGSFIETPAIAHSSPESELVGEQIGPYVVVRSLGRGGMGEVFLGERQQGRFPLRVAIKTIRWSLASDEVMRRFERERAILQSLNHPSIARLRSAGTTSTNLPYLVMDYVDGVPIDEHCQTHQLSIEDRLTLFIAVCAAVQHAHDRGIVHRDLKPKNVICTATGEPTLLDFGIAKLLRTEEAVDLTRTGQRVMTPEYASPEQITGRDIGVTSDVYSLGVVLYELLTGARPYRGAFKTFADAVQVVTSQSPPLASDVVEQMHHPGSDVPRVATGPPEKGRALQRRLVGDLDAILAKALAKAPESRYASAAAMMHDIGSHMGSRPISARGRSAVYLTACLVKRHAPLSARTAERSRLQRKRQVGTVIADVVKALESEDLSDPILTQRITEAQAALALVPHDVRLHRAIGTAANRLGLLQARAKQFQAAAESFETAFHAAEAILERHADDVLGRRSLTGNARNIGVVLDCLASDAADAASPKRRASEWYEEARRELEAMRVFGMLPPTGEYVIEWLDSRLASHTLTASDASD